MTGVPLAFQAQVSALIESWQREIAENRQEEADYFGVSDDMVGYHRGYADALDSCVQALKLL